VVTQDQLTTDEIRFVALHEAAHAVVAAHLGMPVSEIGIGLEHGLGGYAQPSAISVRQFRAMGDGAFRKRTEQEMQLESSYRYLCVCFAGPFIAKENGRLGSNRDSKEIEATVQRLGLTDADAGCLLKKAMMRAAGILIRRHRAVLRLAAAIEALGTKGVLSGEQVARILGTRRRGQK
jgi:hypothetical protein